MIAPSTWSAMGERAILAVFVMLLAAVGLASYAAGYRDGRRR